MIDIRKWAEKWYDNLFAVSISNPLKTWWKARRYFKFPDVNFGLSFDQYTYPYASSCWRGKILDINIHDVYWKDKWSSPRHERDPLIYICLFSRISLWVVFCKNYRNELNENTNASHVYWEYLLDYLFYNKNLLCYSSWSGDSKLYYYKIYGKSEDGSEDATKPFEYVIPCVSMSLNKRGIKELKKQKFIKE